MKKFLIKAIAAAISLTTASGSCMAWTNPAIQAEYEKKFGWYTDNSYGLRAIISLFKDNFNVLGRESKEDLQEYLEINYKVFKPNFNKITEEDLNRKFEVVKKCYSKQSSLVRSHKPQSVKERERVIKELGDFSAQDAFGIKKRIEENFGVNVEKRADLLSLAKILSEKTNIEISRDAKRRKSLLLKWFNTN